MALVPFRAFMMQTQLPVHSAVLTALPGSVCSSFGESDYGIYCLAVT